MDGEVVAATARDDLRHVLRRCLLAGELSPESLQDLIAEDERGGPVFGQLLDLVDEDVIRIVLADRFVENLTRFLGSAAKPRFSHLPSIFEDNFQLGHNPDELIQSCADAWDDAMSVDLDTHLFPGSAPARTELQRMVLARMGQGVTLSRLLVQLPAEPFSARALLARMLRARMVDTTHHTDADTQQTDDGHHGSFASEQDDVALGEPLTETWMPDEDTPISVGEVLPPEDLRALTDPESLETPVEVELEVEFEDDDPPTEEVIVDQLQLDEGGETAPPEDADDVIDPESATSIDDDPSDDEELPLAQGEAARQAGDLSSLDAWMNHGVDVDEDLDIFDDHDSVRGTATEGGGAFSTEEHNLDRVEVATIEQPIAVDPAPTARFGAPVLSEADAQHKISVANDVLGQISGALDRAEGRGRGQAALQILLEGSPSTYQPLFTNLSADEDGRLPPSALLRNLHHRPTTEHRRLLNQGLHNLIERALSVAMEELPDEAVDEVLEGVAGYRQRLGL